MKTLLHNGVIVNENTFALGYVLIDGERIVAVGEGNPDINLSEVNSIDVDGAFILPGVIDDHVHFREPGLTYKADIASESRAAVAGGVTSFMDMPNCQPATTTVADLEWKFARAAETSHANYSFYIGATNDNVAELRKVDFSRVCGIKLFMGSSTGGMLVDNVQMLRSLFSEFRNTLIAAHCEDETIIRNNLQTHLPALSHGLKDAQLGFHLCVRTREACFKSTRKAVELAKEYHSRLHVLHVTTKKEVKLLKYTPPNITAEACLAHLTHCIEDLPENDLRMKCNPAIKFEEDMNALIDGVEMGALDVIGTDHAPHLLSEKEADYLQSPSGMPSIQFSLPYMLSAADDFEWSKNLIVKKMCHAPADIFGVEQRGYLREGYYADIAVVRRLKQPHTLTDADVISKCGWTPLAGEEIYYRVEMTFVNGGLAYQHGKVSEERYAQPLTFATNRNKQ